MGRIGSGGIWTIGTESCANLKADRIFLDFDFAVSAFIWLDFFFSFVSLFSNHRWIRSGFEKRSEKNGGRLL